MRLSYFVSTLWYNLFRRKISTITAIILLSASMVSLVLTQSLSTYIQNVTNTALINSIAKRTLLVGLETGAQNEPIEDSIAKIRKMDHVIAAYSSYGRSVSGTTESLKITSKLDGNIILYGANNAMLPKIVKGQAYTDQDQNVGIKVHQ
jgi:cell division protein FtsX